MACLVCLVDDVTASASTGWGTLAQPPVERNQYVTGPQVAPATGPGAAGLQNGLGLKQYLVTPDSYDVISSPSEISLIAPNSKRGRPADGPPAAAPRQPW